jgi:hypothetical protein
VQQKKDYFNNLLFLLNIILIIGGKIRLVQAKLDKAAAKIQNPVPFGFTTIFWRISSAG